VPAKVPAKAPATVRPTPTPQPPPVLDFRLTTFNVLGASHTSHGGSHAGYASGRARAGGVAALLARHGSDVAGFQELQGPQLAVLEHRTGMDFYPGFSMGHLGTENSIGWRRDRWVAVERHTVAIPYFNGGIRQMPFVRLRSTTTGIEAWFANFHNPAETARFHHQQRFRVRATQIEAALARRLVASTGLPVFITGDMNERAPYFCRLTATAPMVAARGGSNTGACLAGRPRAVDWIFGSRGVAFTSYDEDRSHLVDVTTDHPVVTAGVHLVGKPGAH
jgi:endonuclease/exonuclease/phosphatase family metal-dependent hydrolase